MRENDFEKCRMHILIGCTTRPMSAKELSDSYGIPIGQCYRVIRVLLSEGALKCTLTVNRRGNTIPLFRTTATEVQIMTDRLSGTERPGFP